VGIAEANRGVFCRVLEGGRVKRGDEIPVVSKEKKRTIHLRPIGHVESDFHHAAPPEQIRAHESRLVLKEEFTEGLEGLQAGDRLTVVFHFHLAQGYELRQHPRGESSLASWPNGGYSPYAAPAVPIPSG
jgi:hypothetical protein